MSEADARKWIGRSVSIGDVSSSLEGERLTGCRVTEKEFEARKFFEEGFKIEPSELGLPDAKVRVFEVEHADGLSWDAPGSTIMVGKKLVLTCWDGVYFVLQKNEANKPPPSSPR